MSRSISKAAYILVGCVITSLTFIFSGASTPGSTPTTIDARYDVDFDTIEFTSKQLTIEITDHKNQNSYLYAVPTPTKSIHRGDSPINTYPPKLIATIDLKTAGNKELDATIDFGILPIKPTGHLRTQNPANNRLESLDK